jgi:hypothetical protein
MLREAAYTRKGTDSEFPASIDLFPGLCMTSVVSSSGLTETLQCGAHFPDGKDIAGNACRWKKKNAAQPVLLLLTRRHTFDVQPASGISGA